MTSVTLEEAQQRLSELLAGARNDQVIEIVAPDGHAFRVVPVGRRPPGDPTADSAWPGYPKAGSCRGMIWMADDFDAPLEDLAEYMA
ncbi:MAG: DUF2281 domain-containing protein [Planctomycetota bacterium]|nr:DUF2281 domain-containing protein [Planctomycetota bacterium]